MSALPPNSGCVAVSIAFQADIDSENYTHSDVQRDIQSL